MSNFFISSNFPWNDNALFGLQCPLYLWCNFIAILAKVSSAKNGIAYLIVLIRVARYSYEIKINWKIIKRKIEENYIKNKQMEKIMDNYKRK